MSRILKITSITHHTTAEGERLVATYSRISDRGEILSQNERKGIIVMDESIIEKIQQITDYMAGFITENEKEG